MTPARTRPSEYASPLEQLLIDARPQPRGIVDQDRQEAKDAAWECPHDRLPHDPSPPCGCWPGEPAPAVPALIPAWVMADARELCQGGMTLRKVARAIFPATGCPDVPACEQLLALNLSPALPIEGP